MNALVFANTHRASVISILGDEAPRVESRGSRFFNVDRWTARHLVARMCKWASQNPGGTPTAQVMNGWVTEANGVSVAPQAREIVIAQTPTGDALTTPVAMALVGGGYHEALHTKFSARRNLNLDEVYAILAPRWGKVPNWGAYAGALLEWGNLIEDIRIERRGNEWYPGIFIKLCDLQDLILTQEAESRAIAEKDPNVRSRMVISGVFRDLGLGYSTALQDEVLRWYEKIAPDAYALVDKGALAGLLDTAIALSATDDLGHLRVAMDVIATLVQLGQQPKNGDGDSQSGQKEKGGDKNEGKGGGKNGDEGAGEKGGEKGEKEKGDKGGGNGDGDGDETGGDGAPDNGGDGGAGKDGDGPADGKEGGGDAGGKGGQEGDAGGKGKGKGEKDGKGKGGSGSGDGSASGKTGKSGKGKKSGEGGQSTGDGGGSTESGNGAGGYRHEPGRVATSYLLAVESGIKSGLKDANSALEGAIKGAKIREQADCAKNEAPYRPFSTAYDTRAPALPTHAGGAAGDRLAVEELMQSVRRECAFLRARLRSLFLSQQQTEIVHGVRRGSAISDRTLVESAGALRAGRIPDRAYQRAGDRVDNSVAAVVVLDQSQSMAYSHGFLRNAVKGVLAIVDPLDALGCAVEAVGFRDGSHSYVTDNGTYHRTRSIHIDIFKSFNERLTAVKGRFNAARAEGGTPMADGVQYGLDALQSRREAHRILFIVTDGEPNFGHSPIINRQIRIAREAGVHVVGVGIGASASYVQKTFTDHVFVPDVKDLPQELIKKLQNIIDTRRVKGAGMNKKIAAT